MLIVFDLDGTLSDSRAAIVNTFLEACTEHGHAAPEGDDVAARIGLPLDRMFRELAPGGDVPALVESYKDAYLAHDLRHTRAFPGVPELIASLEGTLAIATSKTQTGAVRSATHIGVVQHFSVILGVDSVQNPKPAPDMLLEAMRVSGHGPGDTVMVGDTTFDLDMADAAGVRGLGVAWGSHGRAGLSRWPVAEDAEELGAILRAAQR